MPCMLPPPTSLLLLLAHVLFVCAPTLQRSSARCPVPAWAESDDSSGDEGANALTAGSAAAGSFYAPGLSNVPVLGSHQAQPGEAGAEKLFIKRELPQRLLEQDGSEQLQGGLEGRSSPNDGVVIHRMSDPGHDGAQAQQRPQSAA